ncbi:MAG: protein kinase [Planctomycetes bacterium]|nr:protein kinase [Planctomycetota bacterium]
MTDENQPPEQSDNEERKPEPGPTKRLEKAIEDMESGDIVEGTLVDIHAGTSEVPVLGAKDEPSVSSELRKQKGAGGSGTPDVQPAATMYEPTQPGHVSGGSTEKTVFGPTGQGAIPQGSSPGTMNQPGGGRPIAPFGGKIMVGTRIGQIEVNGVLGKGGMGEVFKGYHHALDIGVAIKVLPDELSRNELVRQRFLREARLCVKLDHPNIVRVYNVDEYAGNLYLVMEMVEGADAASMLKNGGRFRYKRALEIGSACADALAYAHTQGLVHRDVKPHNILLGASDGKIKLSDFGLARAATSSSHLTMSGQIMGTPHYMSPEQAEAKEVTDKSDVYSLGVTLYHMLTGETPFVGDTPISVAVQHIAKEIIYPEVRFKPFPKELVAVLKRMTAKDPAKRCSAKQAAVWLRKLITMAPQDDIAHPDEQAMKSMAPVVRESQAFEAAKKEREQRDHQARELAQTMLATIQEDSGRRPSVRPTTQEAPQPTSSQVIIERRGSGGLVAAVVVLALALGGGGAAWYFTVGPGAPKQNNSGPIAGTNTNGANTAPDNKGTIGVGNTAGNNGTDAGTTDAGTTDASATDAGNTDAGTTDAGTSDAGTDDGGTTPPPDQDDPLVAAALLSAGNGINNADTLADLEIARRKLEQARAEIGKASASQRDEFDELEARYTRQYAVLGTNEASDRIREALEQFEAKRGDDTDAAIDSLNNAIKERDVLVAMKMPDSIEGSVSERRKALIDEVSEAVDDYWKELDDEARRLEELKQFEAADKQLEQLAKIHNTTELVGGVRDRRTVIQIRGLHKSILDDLDIPDFKDAAALLKRTEEIGVPEALKAEHEQVKTALNNKIEETVTGFLDQAKAAVAEADFTAARNALDSATELPEKTPVQKTRVADMAIFVTLSEQLLGADKAIKAGDFNTAQTRLNEAKATLDDSQNRTVDESLKTRYTALSSTFDTQLATRFNELMSAAKAKLKERDFEATSQCIKDANDLPLNTAQKTELEGFRSDSEEALATFARELIARIEKNLDANEFEKARVDLETAENLKIPADLKEKLNELKTRSAEEAVKRHGELLESARTALKSKQWVKARDAIAQAMKIPVAKPLADDATDLEAQFIKELTAEVNRHIEAADKHLEKSEFHEARLELEAAAEIALTDELDRQVKRRLKLLAEALESHFAELLRKAEGYTDAKLYSTAEEALENAGKLKDLTQDQLIRLSDAQDKLKKAIAARIEDLFKDLKEAVDKGDEKAGEEVIKKLEKFNLDPGKQSKLRTLKAALTGETDSQRYARLPRHLQVLWNDRNCKSEQLIKVDEEITALNVTPDGKYAVAGTNSGKVFFYNLKRGTKLGNSAGGSRRITAVAFSADGNMAASGNDDGNVVLFDLSGSTPQARDLGNVGDDVFGLAFQSKGNVLFVATRDGALTRFNPNTRTKIGTVATGLGRAQCMALSPDEKLLAIGGEDAEIAVFDADRMVRKEKLDGPGDSTIQSVGFSADGSQLIAGSEGDDVGVWDTKHLTAKAKKEYKGLGEWVRGVGFSADGRRCAGFDSEDRLIVWDIRNGDKGARTLEYSDKLKSDKDFIVSAGVIGPDGTVLIGTREGELLHMYLKSAGE